MERDEELLADDLERWLAGEDAEWPGDYAFNADSAEELDTAMLDDRANWTLRRIRRAHQELARIERTAAAERARINKWEQDRSAGPRQLIETERANLEAITRRLIELNPKRRSVRLPNGTVKLTAPGQPSLVIDDDRELLGWLKENHPELVEVEVVEKHKGKTEVKKLLAAVAMSDEERAGSDTTKALSWAHDKVSGERVPGVHLETPALDRFDYDWQ